MQAEFFQQSARILSVTELTRAIRGTLESRFAAVWVQGEVSNYKLHPSGHQYFTLKDQRAQISCVVFRNTLPPGSSPLADGAQVQVYGRLSVFEARGQYQLSVEVVQPRGLGALQAKFEALKRKLDGEGLFDPAHKRPLPKYPKRIGIVTSASGAAIRDILNVLSRRAPGLQILINPVRVQGPGAATEIAVAIRELATPNTAWLPLDLIVIARGGGSIEDLWEFNEEIVARAIYDSAVPIVSAIGHEIDFTIADFVADLRAATPSAAAELIVADVSDLLRRLAELSSCLDRNLRNFVAHAQTRLRFLSEKALAREPLQRLRDAQQRLDLVRERLTRTITIFIADRRNLLTRHMNTLQARRPERELSLRRSALGQLERRFLAQLARLLQQARDCFSRSEGMLRLLGPEATLRRGYSITRTAAGEIVRSVRTVRPNTRIRTRVQDGEFDSKTDP